MSSFVFTLKVYHFIFLLQQKSNISLKKYIHTTIKPRTSINRVIRVNGKHLQYTVSRLGDNNLNVGRIHEK